MHSGTLRHPLRHTAALRAACVAAALACLATISSGRAEPAGQPAAQTGPRIEFPEPKHDFGSVPKGESVHHVFTVKNAGDAPLEIREVRPACGCTTTGEWTRVIAAGTSGTIPIQLATAQFTGPVHKTITITSNDPAHPLTVLEITASIWTPIQISNPVVIFPAFTQLDQVVTRTVTIRNQVAGTLALTELQSDQPEFRPALREIVPGQEFELTITTVPPLRNGTQTARISMKSSNLQMPLLIVQAVATVLPAVQVAPTEIMLTTLKLAAAEKKYDVVLNHRGGDLKLSELKTNVDGVEILTTTTPNGKQSTITLTFPAGFEARTTGKMFFSGKTSHPELPSFEVPIVYVGNR